MALKIIRNIIFFTAFVLANQNALCQNIDVDKNEFSELKNEGLETQAALNILCNFEDRPEMVKIEKDEKQISCPENAKSWETNVSSWTNENAQISLRGLTVYYDDLLHKTEDKLIEIAAHLKESGFDMEVNTMEISKMANNFQFNY